MIQTYSYYHDKNFSIPSPLLALFHLLPRIPDCTAAQWTPLHFKPDMCDRLGKCAHYLMEI